jgi:FkbM family methyltransferase
MQMRFPPQVLEEVGDVVAKHLRLHAWDRWPPEEVTLFGVKIPLDDAWATDVIRLAIYTGTYEDREAKVLRATLRPDDVYMEIGAGIGFVATLAATIVRRGAVTAYEANPKLTPAIEATARSNDIELRVVNAVLGETPGTTPFHVAPDFWMSGLAPSPGSVEKLVPQLSFREELEGVRPTYLMIDIEGGEEALLQSSALPPSVRAVCLEVHPDRIGKAGVWRVAQRLAEQGFLPDFAVSGASVLFCER